MPMLAAASAAHIAHLAPKAVIRELPVSRMVQIRVEVDDAMTTGNPIFPPPRPAEKNRRHASGSVRATGT